MFPEITSALSALKSASEIVKTLGEVKDQSKVADVQGKILDAQSKALEAQQKLTEMHEEISILKQKIASFDDWKVQSERYRLTDFGSGTFAYNLVASDNETPHLCCPNCFGQRRKSILQCRGTNAFNQRMMVCHDCKSEINLGSPQYPDQPQVKRGSGWSA